VKLFQPFKDALKSVEKESEGERLPVKPASDTAKAKQKQTRKRKASEISPSESANPWLDADVEGLSDKRGTATSSLPCIFTLC
jgi:hypothetical protein